jgi:hypothetical protein
VTEAERGALSDHRQFADNRTGPEYCENALTACRHTDARFEQAFLDTIASVAIVPRVGTRPLSMSATAVCMVPPRELDCNCLEAFDMAPNGHSMFISQRTSAR